MKSNILKWMLAGLAVTLFMPSMPFGVVQSVLSAQTLCGAGVAGCARTTLSSALAAGAKNNIMVVASASGISASTNSVNVATNSGGDTLCLIDRELVKVRSISSTTFTVARAIKGAANGHISGAQVVCGYNGTWNPNTGNATGVFLGTGGNFQPSGSCTRANQQFLPLFAVDGTYSNGFTYDCLGGKWVQGTLPDAPDATPLILASNIDLGQVAYASIGTNTTDVNGQEWLTSIMVPKSGYITGIKVLCGNTCTTDNVLGILRDSNGNLIANSATAGVLLSGANTFQTLAFTAPVFIVGPARYFVGIQGNGTAAGAIETVATLTFVNLVATSASGTFGTVTSTFTVPTTFTAGKAPVVELYY